MKMKSIPAGYEIFNGRMRKICNQNQVRNPITRRCNKVRSKSVRKKRSPVVPAGYEIINGRIRKSCTQNQVRSPVTGRCNKVRSKSARKRKSYKKRKIASPKKVLPPKKKVSPPKKVQKTRKSLNTTGECPICYEETPYKLFGCNHPLCEVCYEGMVASGRTMRCPLCRLIIQ